MSAAFDAAIAAEELVERLTVVRVIAMVSLPLPPRVEQEHVTESMAPAEAA
jgi:hypothetical protein